MQNQFLNKDKIFTSSTQFSEILLQSNGYTDFYDMILKNNIEYIESKTYEISVGGFVDFNQHMYENINDMNSISTGIYLEKSLITFRIFIWESKGEGFEIFKHVLRGEEVSKLKTMEDIKEYLYVHINELECGIISTYNKDTNKAFEEFGSAIESRRLSLTNILQYISIENNMDDFR